jgi:betaine-homocysteine S-methyltransferase
MAGNLMDRIRQQGILLGDGGYLLELERRGYVDSGSEQETVGTGRGSGQFTPEVAVEHPEALRGLHAEFLRAGSQVLQALTFFATREKLTRAGYGAQTEAINTAAVRLAREVAGGHPPAAPTEGAGEERLDRDSGQRRGPGPGTRAGPALVAGSVSRTQLLEREGPAALGHARDLFAEQIRLLQDAGVDFLILETFFRLDEMRVALECARASGLPMVATMSFRPRTTESSDGHSPAACARAMAEAGADVVGANCEQEPRRVLPILREMRAAVDRPIAAQPAAFRTTDEIPCFTRLPQFPDDLETIQISRQEFVEFARAARSEGIAYVGGCCGCNASYIRAMARGLEVSRQ